MDIFALGPKITLLPVLHGSGDFALEIRRRLLTNNYDCLAVPLPPAFEESVELGITHLPAITLAAQREGGLDGDPTAYTVVPIDPCQPVISGIRTAIEHNIDRAYIDLEVQTFEPKASVLPDPYALKEVSLEKFATAILTGLPKPDPNSQQMAGIWPINSIASNSTTTTFVASVRSQTGRGYAMPIKTAHLIHNPILPFSQPRYFAPHKKRSSFYSANCHLSHTFTNTVVPNFCPMKHWPSTASNRS
jgi:hypothetical protein